MRLALKTQMTSVTLLRATSLQYRGHLEARMRMNSCGVKKTQTVRPTHHPDELFRILALMVTIGDA